MKNSFKDSNILIKMNKFVLLTGANGGIGKAVLLSLLEKEYKVIALDLTNSNIKDLDVTFIKCDVTNKKELAKAYEEVKNITPTLYAIINTIGIFKMESLIEGSEEDFRRIFEVNFFGVYSMNKLMFPLLEKGSKIINLTSEVAKYSPQPLQAYYNLSKIALDSYTDSLRRECNYLGIKVIKIQSGSMKTTLLTNANDEYEKMANESKYFKAPLTKLKFMMDKELKKQNDPSLVGKLVNKILEKKHPKIKYKIKNSFALSFVGHLPETWQDKIYTKVIK